MVRKSSIAAAEGADAARVRALIGLVVDSEAARARSVPLHHLPESLSQSPAKLEVLVNSLVVFVNRGVANVTVQDLLDAAGISRRTFYKYFRNKIDVLENLYKLAIDLMVVRYKVDVGRAVTVPEAAQRFVDVFFDYHADLGPVIRLMQEEALRSDSPLAPHRAAAMQTVAGLVSEEVARISGKRIDELSIRVLLWAMESTSLEVLRQGSPLQVSLAEGKKVVSEIALATFERALARPRA